MTSRRLKECRLDFGAVFYLDGSVPRRYISIAVGHHLHSTNNKQVKSKMQNKTKKKKERKEIEVPDLTPPKDPKGGVPPGPCGPGGHGPNPNLPAVQKP